MNIQEAKDIRLVDFLAGFGYEPIIGTVPGKCRNKQEKARLPLKNNPETSWYMKIDMYLQWSASY